MAEIADSENGITEFVTTKGKSYEAILVPKVIFTKYDKLSPGTLEDMFRLVNLAVKCAVPMEQIDVKGLNERAVRGVNFLKNSIEESGEQFGVFDKVSAENPKKSWWIV